MEDITTEKAISILRWHLRSVHPSWKSLGEMIGEENIQPILDAMNEYVESNNQVNQDPK